ncbi:MAG: hypothetical protein ABL921_30415 [Pirellula sp.]
MRTSYFRIFGGRPGVDLTRDVFVHHHLGLGDMIHCNGMVRGLLERLEDNCNAHVFCKQRNVAMVSWMYRDEPRIVIEAIDDRNKEGAEIRRILRERRSSNLLSVGHRALRPLEKRFPHLFFDQLFYLQQKVPYETRFTKCFWIRDMLEEERVFRKLAPKLPYAFVHDDPSRGYCIDTRAIPFPVVRNDTSESIFHLGLVLERAAEVHCMESSIRCMMESLHFQNGRLIYHNFRYPDRPLGTATCLPWTEINYSRAA